MAKRNGGMFRDRQTPQRIRNRLQREELAAAMTRRLSPRPRPRDSLTPEQAGELLGQSSSVFVRGTSMRILGRVYLIV